MVLISKNLTLQHKHSCGNGGKAGESLQESDGKSDSQSYSLASFLLHTLQTQILTTSSLHTLNKWLSVGGGDQTKMYFCWCHMSWTTNTSITCVLCDGALGQPILLFLFILCERHKQLKLSRLRTILFLFSLVIRCFLSSPFFWNFVKETYMTFLPNTNRNQTCGRQNNRKSLKKRKMLQAEATTLIHKIIWQLQIGIDHNRQQKPLIKFKVGMWPLYCCCVKSVRITILTKWLARKLISKVLSIFRVIYSLASSTQPLPVEANTPTLFRWAFLFEEENSIRFSSFSLKLIKAPCWH